MVKIQYLVSIQMVVDVSRYETIEKSIKRFIEDYRQYGKCDISELLVGIRFDNDLKRNVYILSMYTDFRNHATHLNTGIENIILKNDGVIVN